MRKMKDSGVQWIGEIPVDWEIRKLKYVANVQTGNTPSKSNSDNYAEEGFLWVKPDSLSDFTPIIDTKEKLSTKGKSMARVTKENSTLVCCIGSVGKLGFSTQKVAYNQQINAVEFNDPYHWKYGMYYLSSQTQQHKYYMNGNVVYILNSESHKKIVVPYFLKKEQQHIVDFLDVKCAEIDAIIKSKERTNEKLKQYRQSLIYETVTKGLDKNVKMKDSGVQWIGEIPEHWEVKKLKYLFEFGTGLSITRAELLEEGIPCINYGDIHSKYNFDLDLKRDKVKYADVKLLASKANAIAKENDFIFCDTSEDIEGCGNCVYIKNADGEQIFSGSHTVLARPIEDISSRYLAYLFSTSIWRTQVRSKVSGIKVFSITQNILKNVDALIPSNPEESKAICDFLDVRCTDIDKVITSNIKTIKKLKEYRQSLIYEVVTGKVEV